MCTSIQKSIHTYTCIHIMNLSALGYLGEQLSQHNIQNANSGLQMNEKVTGSWKIYFIIF